MSFVLSKKSYKKIFSAILCFIILFIVTVATAKIIQDHAANAITGDGEQVTVTAGERIPYESWATNLFTVTSSSGTFTAWCAEPAENTPSGPYNAKILDDTSQAVQLVKLLAYISTNSNSITDALMNSLYNNLAPSTNPDLRYAYVHATIGYIYSNDTKGLSQDTITKVANIKNSLLDIIQNNGDAWLMAKNYKVFETNVAGKNVQAVVWIENNNQYGDIAVQKCDIENSSCSPQGNGSFEGITFSVYNASGARIYNSNTGQFYNDGDLITSANTGANGTVTFSNLPINTKYRVAETSTNSSYILTANSQTITIATSGDTSSLVFKDNIKRGDVKFKKVDADTGETMSNVVFSIKSTTTSESHILVSDEDGIVDTSSGHALHTNHTNGYDNIEKPEYLGYGTWFGAQDAVNDQRGALPYDTYTITELECDANKFCYDVGLEPKTFTINTDGSTLELDDWENDCAKFSIKTTATDAADGDKTLAVNSDVRINDKVEYCLKQDMEFTIKGILMDKTTKKPVKIGDKVIEQIVKITPEEDCGTLTMSYNFNTSGLGGKELIIFDYVYYSDELVIFNTDFNDEDQSIVVAPDPPETGLIMSDAKFTDNNDYSPNIILVATLALPVGYIAMRLKSRRKFLKH